MTFKSERSETVLTPTDRPWRIAWPFLHEKKTKRPNGTPLPNPRYEALLLAPKLNPDPMQCPNYALLARLCMEAATKSWGGWPQGGAWPIKDGDNPPASRAPAVPGQAPAQPQDLPWRKGHWYMNISSSMEPGPRVAILQNGQAMEIPARSINGRTFYKSGDYAVVSLNAYTYHNEQFGVNFGFEGVFFVAEGEAIGGGPRSVDQMFGAIAGTIHPNAPGSTVPQPPGYGVPPMQPGAPPAHPSAPPMQPAAPQPGFTPPQPPMQPAAAPQPGFNAPSAAPPAQPTTGAQYAVPGQMANGGYAAPPPPAPPPGLPPFPTR